MSWRRVPMLLPAAVVGAIWVLAAPLGCGKSRAESYNRMGEAKLAQRDLDGAKASFDKALEIAPEFAIAHRNLGRYYAMKGEDERAKELFDKAIKLDPREARAFAELGLLAMKHEDYPQMLRFCDEAVLLDDTIPVAQSCACVARATKGQTGGAIRACKKAIELDADGTTMVVYFTLAILLEETEDFDGAIDAYKGVLARTPLNADAHHRIAGAYAQKREDDKALWHLEKAIELNPQHDQAYRAIIEYYTREENLEKVEEWFLKARQAVALPQSVEAGVMKLRLQKESQEQQTLPAPEAAAAP